MSIADYFRRAPAPSPTVEESREQRREELVRELARVDAECEALSQRIAEFLYCHKIPRGGYYGGSLEELARMPALELSLRQAETVLNQRRAAILAELAALTTNPNETVFIEGKAVSHGH